MRKQLFTLLLVAFSVTFAFAQSEKYSVSTQMFLNEMKEMVQPDGSLKLKQAKPGEPAVERIYAEPEMVNGRAYIAAFVRVTDASVASQLESAGVIVENDFLDGTLFTTLIPVDAIEKVAEIDGVTAVSVSQVMQTASKTARARTNVDDILTNSADAQAAGLSKSYDGTGVLLGVIDDGIDFQHKAFSDASGKTRIVRAYVWDGSTAKIYDNSEMLSSPPTTDNTAKYHGTHVAAIAGGSTVNVTSSAVNVLSPTSSANVTYGGMAPGASLYLAGIKSLADSKVVNALKDMVEYAEANDMPLVVNCSWGSQWGPHDGTGVLHEIFNDYFNNNSAHPNCFAVFSSGNFAEYNRSEGGGIHLHGTATKTAPLGAIIRSKRNTSDYGGKYNGYVASVWTRTEGDIELGCKVYVLNASTGAILKTVTIDNISTEGTQVEGLANYYSGSLYVYKDYTKNKRTDFKNVYKTQLMLYASSEMNSTSAKAYTLAFEVYPLIGSVELDAWGGDYDYFASIKSTSGHTWTNGDDDVSVEDIATAKGVIAVGSYISASSVKTGSTTHSYGTYSQGDIVGSSGYATAASSPIGVQQPFITAPGLYVISAVSHLCDSYLTGNMKTWKADSPDANPYGASSGTSMAAPVVSGTIALWMQVAKEKGKKLYLNDVKNIMAQSAITDTYTNGTNAKRFGNGKIDALAGLAMILAEPTIIVDNETVDFGSVVVGKNATATLNVSGLNLEGDITLSVNGNGFTLSETTVTAADATAGKEITVTFAPAATGDHTGTITLTSTGAETKTVTLTGSGRELTPTITTSASALSFTGSVGTATSRTFTVSGTDLSGDITLTLTDANGVFSVSPTKITPVAAAPIALKAETTGNATTVTVTFNAATAGDYNGSIALTADGATTVTVALTATAQAGGTASDAYLNIANYATIDDVYTPTNVANLYKFTEYDEDNAGWLTMSAYGAYRSALEMKDKTWWIKRDGSTTTSASWTAYNVFLGNTAYFTGNSGTIMKNNTLNFYVTNTDAIKVYGVQNNTSGTRKITINAYECTVDANGNITASTTTAATASHTSTSADKFIVSITSGLETSKVYKIDVIAEKANMYEIGFRTPLTAKAMLKANPSELSFSARPGATVTQTFTVTGTKLTDDVTVSVSGANFSVDKSNITISEAEAGATVTVTFTAPETEGTYTGTVTLTSGTLTATVALTGMAYKGGEAKGAYLNIARYATIDEAGWSAAAVNKFYSYTEYPANDVAWLTIPAYGAWQARETQGWINGSGDAIETVTGINSWVVENTDKKYMYKGATYYYDSAAAANGFGTRSKTNTTDNTLSFYVTNCVGVALYGSANDGANDTYYPYMRIYECTENADGSITENSDWLRGINTKEKGHYITFLALNDESDLANKNKQMDPTKIYKVVVGGPRNYLYEVAFATPLDTYYGHPLNEVLGSDDYKVGNDYRILLNDLIAVHLSEDGKTLYCKDDNEYAAKSDPAAGQTDYLRERNVLQERDWDQSNWIMLTLPDGKAFTADPSGYHLRNVRGTLTDKDNPVMTLTVVPAAGDADEADYAHDMDTFIVTNFDNAYLSDNAYFFMPPKPMQVANVMWAEWTGEKFRVPESKAFDIDGMRVDGSFFANFSLYEETMPTLEEGKVYKFVGLAKRENSSATTLKSLKAVDASTGYTVYPLYGFSYINPENPTGIGVVKAGAEVVDVTYSNVAGMTQKRPFQGVNIVITTYSDGSRTVTKEIN